jgi:exodeoxyribonuclease VII large subunit
VVPDEAEVLAILRQQAQRLMALLRERAAVARSRVDALASRRVLARPSERLLPLAERVDDLGSRLQRAVRRRHQDAAARWRALGAALEALSPLKVLQRGYSLTTRAVDGALLRAADQTQPGDRLDTQLARGRVSSRVEDVFPEEHA